jgi:hypothetical protein
MDKDEVVSRLRAAGLTVASEQRNNNGTGWVIRLDTAAIATVGTMAMLRSKAKTKMRPVMRSG